MQPMIYRSNRWMMWPVIIVLLTVIIAVGGATLSDTDLFNQISAGAAADRVYSETQQNTVWFNATLPLELEKAMAESRDYIAGIEEDQRVEQMRNDRIAEAKRLLTLGGIILLLLAGAAAILVVALTVRTKALYVANREEAIRRDFLAAHAQSVRRAQAAPVNLPRPVEVDTPQPLSLVRSGAVRVVRRPAAPGPSPNGAGARSPNGAVSQPTSWNGQDGSVAGERQRIDGGNGNGAGHHHYGGTTEPKPEYEQPSLPTI